MPFAITNGLLLREVDVLTAQADDAARLPDTALLDRARERERILFSQDTDLLRVARERQETGAPFAGLVFAHQLRVNIGTCVVDLELIAQATEPEDWRGQIVFLPLGTRGL